jgi:tol-pal system protein YbgF
MTRLRISPAAAVAALVGLAAAGTGCVLPDQMKQMQKDVAALSQQLRRVERDQSDLQQRVELLGNPETGEAPPTRAELADLEFRLDGLSDQVSVAQERMNDVEQRLDGFSLDLQQVRTGTRGAHPPDFPDDAPPAPPTDLSHPGSPPRSAAGAVPDPEALYNTAYADFSKGNYALAISGFQEYQERFPESALADNALYWIAECHFSQGDYRNAVDALDHLLQTYPRSDKAAAGNLKKALAFLEQNQLRQGIVQLQYVVAEYPGTDEARLARDKLASLGNP